MDNGGDLGWGDGCGGVSKGCNLGVVCRFEGGMKQPPERKVVRGQMWGAIRISAWTAKSEEPWVWSLGPGLGLDGQRGLGFKALCRAGFKSWSKGLQERVSSGVRCPAWSP